jgi:methylated-DNA-[protein]-cysteine S-methyltransferase
MTHRVQMASPIGVLTIESNDEAVTFISLPSAALPSAAPPNAALANAEGLVAMPATGTDEPGAVPEPLAAAVAQLGEYFAGRRRRFDIPVQVSGTPFQERVWLELREIPFGETVSYAELATMVGHPKAFRAVGQANGANPVPIVLPCHRVIAAGGGLGGYGGGLPMKRRLLALEGAQLSFPATAV